MTEPQRQALDALYLAEGWTDASGNHLEPVESDWVVSAYRDAHVFSPGGGRRANLLWLVRAEQVVSFAPSSETLEQAYERVVVAD